MNSQIALRKLIRFALIYGPSRALFKAAGRLRLQIPFIALRLRRKKLDIAIVGCGQFAYSAIGYFLFRRFGCRVLGCFDISPRAASTLARGLGVPHQCADIDALLALPGLRTVYIASNHASHADYAVRALGAGLDVYVEKPIAVNLVQLAQLERVRRQSSGRLFAGYNRPFSSAVLDLRSQLQPDPDAGISLQCFVAGHVLAVDHWYRRPGEGTRICGNVGHWLDLFVHILAWRGMPQYLDIALSWANDSERDDNLAITIATERKDLFSIMLTARHEPFEGINESIQFQHADTICKIDDFRRMVLWQGAHLQRRHYWPKDPGHRNAIAQPYSRAPARNWQEVLDSTLLMFYVADMVRNAQRQSIFVLPQARQSLENLIASR
ncbi:Gfo/Idh/MocA family oxidoreductase [Cyanobium sp. Aljojuca 7D2]|uniref:Gfo/Idh/MocA family protein n=1 Tax=Cyanobium sp. Aljojuca 7D2 TaxID=2823698 RepID=UPI0020CC68DF|nr:Gfo/Idh/MocA family oxidoreductase [Cyanobium sp. Aljojuca 7D2]MCP9892069.1 Gfo/Idh/MocA family oxidoreductase [Cyanobium sp. Aljojuca 7D2]